VKILSVLNDTEICIGDLPVIYLWKYEITVSAIISEMQVYKFLLFLSSSL